MAPKRARGARMAENGRGGVGMRVWALMATVGLLAGCGGAVPGVPAAKPLTGESIAAALQSSGLPVSDVVVHTAESDPNKRLGRPNEYAIKVNWKDSRIASEEIKVEGFNNVDDFKRWLTYNEALSKSSPLLTTYIFTNEPRLLILRIPKDLTPEQAEQYRAWLMTL